MRLAWKKTARFGVPEIFAGIAALSFLVARFVPVLRLPGLCPFKLITGLPCCTCGMTHAFVHLAHGELGRALAANPAGCALAAAVWLFAVLDLARIAVSAPLPDPSPRAWRALAVMGVAVLGVNWVFLVVKVVS